MGSAFYGLSIATTGLFASQKALDVTSHNISNVNTPGYSRQIVNQRAEDPSSTADGTGMLGNGVRALGSKRIRDEYLDYKYWSESVANGEWEVKDISLADIQAVFNEPSDSGVTTVLNDFFNAIQQLSKDPGSSAARAMVKEKGISVAKIFNTTANELEKIQSDLNDSVKDKVSQVNSISEQIRALNVQIYNFELEGQVANDLRDTRTYLTDQLSKLVKINAQEVVVGKLSNGDADKRYQIVVNGKFLVDNFKRYGISCRQTTPKNNPEDINGINNIYWDDGTPFRAGGGEIQGYLDVRDGSGQSSQIEKLKLSGNVTAGGNLTVTVTAKGLTGSPKVINVPVLAGDTPDVVGGKVRAALAADVDVANMFYINGGDQYISLKTKASSPNDTTMNVSVAGNGTGVANIANSTDFQPGTINSFKGVPFYQRQLNRFVQTFTKVFNEGIADYNGDGDIGVGENKIGHADGFGLTGITGIRFFTIDSQLSATFAAGAVTPNDINELYNGMTAKNISLSEDIQLDVSNIFTSTVAGQVGNGEVLQSLINFRHDPKIFNEGTPEDYMRALITNLGIDAQQAQRFSTNQSTILKQINNRRSSNSGVSLDEEMSNMLKFQHAYNASAKLISTLQEVYNVLVNGLGKF
jgi:flagellar hook-associated protein 1 FlgK